MELRIMYIHKGQQFSRLTATTDARIGLDKIAFLCDCGNIKNITARAVRCKRTISCGCAYKSHGLAYHELYPIWSAMMNRCYNSNTRNYALYGGRGIKVDDSWHDVKNFIRDMSPRPSGTTQRGVALYTLERVDSDKGYSPENCIWADRVAQNRNRRGWRH